MVDGKGDRAPAEGGDEQETGTESPVHEAKGASLSHLGKIAQPGLMRCLVANADRIRSGRG